MIFLVDGTSIIHAGAQERIVQIVEQNRCFEIWWKRGAIASICAGPCGRLRRATRFLSTPVDSRRLGTGAARRDEGVRAGPRASGAACVRRRIDRSRQESTGVEFARAERSARGQRLRGGSESTLGRPGVRGRVREGPRTNGKSKCSETRPMGADRKCAEESIAFEGKARSAAKPAARTRTNRIGRALRVAMPPAERFNTFKSHPYQYLILLHN